MTRKFRTSFDKFDYSSVPGERFAISYTASYDDNGVLVLKEVGKRDVYSDIQLYKDECDVNLLIERYKQGDIGVLERVRGFYADVSESPKNLADVLNTVAKAEQFFDSLPIEVKQAFNNSFSEFLVATEKKDFMNQFEPVKPVPPVDDKEVTTDE